MTLLRGWNTIFPLSLSFCARSTSSASFGYSPFTLNPSTSKNASCRTAKLGPQNSGRPTRRFTAWNPEKKVCPSLVQNRFPVSSMVPNTPTTVESANGATIRWSQSGPLMASASVETMMSPSADSKPACRARAIPGSSRRITRAPNDRATCCVRSVDAESTTTISKLPNSCCCRADRQRGRSSSSFRAGTTTDTSLMIPTLPAVVSCAPARAIGFSRARSLLLSSRPARRHIQAGPRSPRTALITNDTNIPNATNTAC